jgi:hypothetical protein
MSKKRQIVSPANTSLCVRQRHLAQESLNIYTTGGLVAWELSEQSVVLFLLTGLEINIVRSSPQKVSTDFYKSCEILALLLLFQFQITN